MGSWRRRRDEETTGRSTPREFRYSNGHVLCLLIFQPVVVLDLFCSVLVLLLSMNVRRRPMLSLGWCLKWH